jgi:hypothetical protein
MLETGPARPAARRGEYTRPANLLYVVVAAAVWRFKRPDEEAGPPSDGLLSR